MVLRVKASILSKLINFSFRNLKQAQKPSSNALVFDYIHEINSLDKGLLLSSH